MAAEITAKFNGVSESIGSMGAAGRGADTGLGALGAQLSSISRRLTGLESKVQAGAEAFVNLGRSAAEAGAAVEVGSAKMGAAGEAVGALTGKVGGLSSALKGMAEIWGALKIEQGLRASVHSAADMQTQMAAMRSAGFSKDAANYARNQSESMAQQFPFASSNDVMRGRRAFIMATGQNNEKLINETLPQILKNAFAVQQVSGGDLKSIVQNMLGIAESRGLAMSSAGIVQASNLATKIAEASQGRMDLQKQEMVLRQAKYGTGILSSDLGITNIMDVAEQSVVAGHSGGGGGGGRGVSQAATAYSMVEKFMLGGKMNKVTYQLLKQMDLIKSGGAIGHSSTTNMNAITKIKGTSESSHDPVGWMMKTLAPSMVAYVNKHPGMYFPGGKSSTGEGLQSALDRLAIQLFGSTGGVNVGNQAFITSNPGSAARLIEARKRVQSSATGDQAAGLFSKTQAGQMQAFKASLTDLETSLGQTFLPMITKIVEALNGFVQMLNGIALQFPKFTAVVSTAAAGLSAFLAVRGFGRLLGGIGSVIGMFKKVGPASAAAATESGVAATATASSWGLAAARIGTAVAGALFAIVYSIRNIEVAGIGIQHFFERVMLSIVAGFDGMFNRLYQSSNNFAIKLGQKEASFFRAIHMTGTANAIDSEVASLKNAGASKQASFNARDNTRLSMFKYEGTSAANQSDYMKQALQSIGIMPQDQSSGRAANTVPNAEKQQLARLMEDAGNTSMPGGSIPTHGRAGRVAHGSAVHRLSESEKALRDQTNALAREFANAKKAVEAGVAKGDPISAIRKKYGHFAEILGMGGDSKDAASALTVGDKLANQAGYKQSTGQLQKLKEQLAAEEKLIAVRKESGSITGQQSQQQDIAAQKGIAGAMQKAADAALKYAQALKDPTLIAAMQTQIEQIKAMGTQLNAMQQGVQQTFQSGIQGFLSNLMRGNMTWKNMLANLNNSILSGMNNNISKSLSQSMTGSASHSGIGQAVLGLFGSGASAMAGSGAGSSLGSSSGGAGMWGGIGSAIFSMLGGSFATGIDNVPHDMVAQIHAGERVVDTSSNKMLTEALSGGRMGGHNVNLSIHAMDSQSVLGAMDGIKRELSMMLGSASSNYNLAGA